MVQEFLDFPEFELGAIFDPGFFHQAFIFLVRRVCETKHANEIR